MRQLASTLNKATGSRIVEPYFEQKFSAAGKKLSSFFALSKANILTDKGKAEEEKQIVHCKNLHDLTNQILFERDYSPNHIVKLGIDGGGSFLKMSLGVINTSETGDDTRSPQQKTSRLLTNSLARDTGVKRQLIVGISEEMPETYENIKIFLDLAQVKDVSLVISCDLKVANILCGIQAHASKHPCCWCDVDSDNLSSCGQSRSIGKLRENYKAFEAGGSKLNTAKQYDNSIHPPLIDGEDTTLVLDVIPPMELHLLLGIVNHLFKNLLQCWAGATEWTSKLNIQMQPFHGGQFAGNDCHKLLQNVDLLQKLVEQSCAFQAQGFVHTFRMFKNVVSACFGQTLDNEFQEKIQLFKDSYLFLPVSVTPKAHAVFYHIPEFINRHGSALGIFSEQATEALHSKFNFHWQRYKRNQGHPEYGPRLLQCVVDYNSKHL
jgi:hypothetical protein